MSDRALPHICMPNIAAMWVDLWAEAYEVPSAVVISSHFTQDSDLFVPDSRQAWLRLAVAVMIASVGAVGMWLVVVVMPVVQAEFAATRGAVSLAGALAFAIVCAVLVTILLLALRQIMGGSAAHDHANAPPPRLDLNLSTNTQTVLLCIASISCCVAMSMPHVHIVSYCGDLGYGDARG